MPDKKRYVESKHNRNGDGEYSYKSGTLYGGKTVLLVFPKEEKPEQFFPETASGAHDKYHVKNAQKMGLSMRKWVKEAARILNSEESDDLLS